MVTGPISVHFMASKGHPDAAKWQLIDDHQLSVNILDCVKLVYWSVVVHALTPFIVGLALHRGINRKDGHNTGVLNLYDQLQIKF